MASALLRSLRSHLPSLHRNYDLLPPSPTPEQDVELGSTDKWFDTLQRRSIVRAALQLAGLFLVGSLLLGGTLWVAVPPLDDVDRPLLHVPTSFEELKALHTLLNKTVVIYPFRTLICFVVTYLYLQAFSLPGSMYLSILAGAVWGVPVALPLCCLCVATGATLCYLISACFGPALFALPKLKLKIESIAQRIGEPGHRENLIPYMIVLRMAPFPPHWALNIACPHLGIGIIPFWISAFLGIMGVTVIHTTVGGGLEQMTSSDDFHIISWRNFCGLAAVICAVCVPIVLKWKWRRELEQINGASEGGISVREMPPRSPIPEIIISDDAAMGGLGLIGVNVDPRWQVDDGRAMEEIGLHAR